MSRSREILTANEIVSPHESYKITANEVVSPNESYKRDNSHGQERLSSGVFGETKPNSSTQVLKDMKRHRTLS